MDTTPEDEAPTNTSSFEREFHTEYTATRASDAAGGDSGRRGRSRIPDVAGVAEVSRAIQNNSEEIPPTQTSPNEETRPRGQETEIGGSQEEYCSLGNTLDCSMDKRKHDTTRNKLSPWKVVARHTGTRRTHYHIIYISTAKNWGHNSKLGKTIRAKEHKCSQITCIQCLYEYITAGPGRDTLKEILIDGDKKVAICVLHSLGISNKQSKGRITSTDGRNHLFFDEGTTRNTVRRRLDYGTSTPHENLYDAEEYHERGNDRTPFLTRVETTLIQDIVSLSERTRNWCFTYVKTKHLTKVKQQDFYA